MGKPYLAVCLRHLDGVIKNKNVINRAINAGIVNYAKNISVSEGEALKACLIAYLNKRPLFHHVKMYLDDMDIEREDMFLDGFFDMDNFYSSGHDSEIPEHLKDDFINNAKMIRALNGLGLKQDYPEIAWDKYSGQKNDNIYVMLSIDILIDFLKNEKTEFERLKFLIYCVLQSIIGKNDAKKTNKDFVFKRAFPKPNKEEKAIIAKYSKQYHWNKLMAYMQTDWHLKYYANYTRGFYFSFEMDINKLGAFAEKSKISSKVKAINALKKDVRKAAIQDAIKQLQQQLLK